MRPEISATGVTIPATVCKPLKVESNRIPLVAKVVITTFLAVLVPVYWHTYGLTNFYGSAMPRS